MDIKKNIHPERIKNILINFPTNIGDTILALPALDLIKANYISAEITAIVSSKTKDLLIKHTFIHKVVIYNKHFSLKEKRKFCQKLKRKYDLMVDFKHSLLPLILKIPYFTPLFRGKDDKMHLKERNIKLIERFINDDMAPRGEFIVDEDRIKLWESTALREAIFIAATSHSSVKMYPHNLMRDVVEGLSSRYKVILLGEAKDNPYYIRMGYHPLDDIKEEFFSEQKIINLAGKTTLLDVYYLLKNYCLLLISIDSSIMHLGSYLNLPIVAIFGPTDYHRYGPWSEKQKILSASLSCQPCGENQCVYNLECLTKIRPSTVIAAVDNLLKSR